eukprot:8429592-Ditylum_brightwellii.AAC.1
MVRSAREHTASERAQAIRDSKIFANLVETWELAVEVLEIQDLGKAGCGILPSRLEEIESAGITH